MTSRACLLAACVALVSRAEADTGPAHSGTGLAPERSSEPVVSVYLRSYSTLAATDGEVVGLVEAALARVPGLRARFHIEPDDRGSVTLADAVASLPDDRTRCAFLHILTRRINARWADLEAIDAALRNLGRSGRAQPNQQRRFRAYARTAGSPGAQALLQRPDELDAPGAPYAAIDGMRLTPSNLWSLVQSSQRTLPSAPPGTPSRARGIALHTVGVRFPSYPTATSARACALLDSARLLAESRRITLQLLVEDDPAASDTLLSRALHTSAAPVAVAIAGASCETWPADDAEAMRMLAALAIPAVRFAHVLVRRKVPDAGGSELLIDGNVASGYELARLWELPGVRARLGNPQRPSR